MRSISSNRKNVAEKNRTKGVSPTTVFWSPEPPIRRRSVYRLLCEVKNVTKRPPWTVGGLLPYFHFSLFFPLFSILSFNFFSCILLSKYICFIVGFIQLIGLYCLYNYIITILYSISFFIIFVNKFLILFLPFLNIFIIIIHNFS